MYGSREDPSDVRGPGVQESQSERKRVVCDVRPHNRRGRLMPVQDSHITYCPVCDSRTTHTYERAAKVGEMPVCREHNDPAAETEAGV